MAFADLAIFACGCVLVAPAITYGLNQLEEAWQRLDETKVVIRFDRQGRS